MRIGFASLVMVLAAGVVQASCVLQAQATCSGNGLHVSEDGLADFISRPQGLLDRNPQGSSLLKSEVRNIAAASRATHRSLATVIQAANRKQSEAIGSGLASASTLCQSSDGSMATEIRKLALESGNSVVTATFLEDSGDVRKRVLSRSGSGAGGTEAASGGGHVLSLRVQPGPLANPFAPLPVGRP